MSKETALKIIVCALSISFYIITPGIFCFVKSIIPHSKRKSKSVLLKAIDIIPIERNLKISGENFLDFLR